MCKTRIENSTLFLSMFEHCVLGTFVSQVYSILTMVISTLTAYYTVIHPRNPRIAKKDNHAHYVIFMNYFHNNTVFQVEE